MDEVQTWRWCKDLCLIGVSGLCPCWFLSSRNQRTVFVIFEAHETCIFFNLNGEKFLRLVVHGPVEYWILRLEVGHLWCPLCDEEARDQCCCRLWYYWHKLHSSILFYICCQESGQLIWNSVSPRDILSFHLHGVLIYFLVVLVTPYIIVCLKTHFCCNTGVYKSLCTVQ